MDEIGTTPSRPARRHLRSPEAVARAGDTPADADAPRGHRQGNGVRIHGIYFAVVSLAALVLVLVAIALAPAIM